MYESVFTSKNQSSLNDIGPNPICIRKAEKFYWHSCKQYLTSTYKILSSLEAIVGWYKNVTSGEMLTHNFERAGERVPGWSFAALSLYSAYTLEWPLGWCCVSAVWETLEFTQSHVSVGLVELLLVLYHCWCYLCFSAYYDLVVIWCLSFCWCYLPLENREPIPPYKSMIPLLNCYRCRYLLIQT